MALDGKIRVNDHALGRHPDLLELIRDNLNSDLDLDRENREIFSPTVSSRSFFNLNPKGNIAVICNNLDLGLLTNNLILEKKGTIGACFILPKQEELSVQKQLAMIFEQIFSSDNLKFILVNILTSDLINQEIVEAIAHFYQSELNSKVNKGEERMERLTGSKSRPRRPRKNQSPVKKIQSTKQIQWVLRIVGENIDQILTNLTDLPIKHTNNLEQAIDLVI
jgi:succinyl-CoA synthetase beta subunit